MDIKIYDPTTTCFAHISQTSSTKKLEAAAAVLLCLPHLHNLMQTSIYPLIRRSVGSKDAKNGPDATEKLFLCSTGTAIL